MFFFNPFTAMLAAPLESNKSARFETIKAFYPRHVSTEKDFCQDAQYWKWDLL